MKRLLLVRHGKSSWEFPVEDRNRPLKERAYRDAVLVVSKIHEVLEGSAVIWTSPAIRALETAKILKRELRIPDEDFFVKPALYTFSARELLKVIQSAAEEVKQLMIVGHNPALTEAANKLGDRYFENIPTTGLTVTEFENNSWRKVHNGRTVMSAFPKDL